IPMVDRLGVCQRALQASRTTVLVAASLLASACSRPAAAPNAIRLVDRFDARRVEGSPSGTATASMPRTEWRFDGVPPTPQTRPSALGPAGASPAPAAFAATRGW